MTAQISDRFNFEQRTYTVKGESDGNLFHPEIFGLEPVMACTASWRGYQATYGVVNGQLCVTDLYVNVGKYDEALKEFCAPALPVFNGALPITPEHQIAFNTRYEGMNFALEYSGGLLLANEFIDMLYEHMGSHPAWKYRHVKELVFKNGRLLEQRDRSASIRKVRNMVNDAKTKKFGRKYADEEIRRYLSRTFEHDYGIHF